MTERECVTPDEKMWLFTLYVAGDSKKSRDAIANLKNVCEKYFKNQCVINVIDLTQHPEVATRDQIFATPFLKIQVPTLLKQFIGDLSQIERVFVELDIPLKR